MYVYIICEGQQQITYSKVYVYSFTSSLSESMYIYMCMYICRCLCICIYTKCMYVCMYVCMYMWTYISHIFAVEKYVCGNTYMYFSRKQKICGVCVYVYVCMRMCMCIYGSVCMYMWMFTYVYIYNMYVYIFRSPFIFERVCNIICWVGFGGGLCLLCVCMCVYVWEPLVVWASYFAWQVLGNIKQVLLGY